MPREQELALMHFKDKDYRKALRRYEHQFYETGAQVSVIAPLQELYLREGAIDDAIVVIEKALETRPDDVEVLDLALNLYREALLPERYLQTLQMRIRTAPSSRLLRELVELHAFNADRGGEVLALTELVGGAGANDAEYQRLARLHVALNDPAAASTVIKHWLEDRNPSLGDFERRLAMEVFLLAGQPESAVGAVVYWLRPRVEPAAFERAVEALRTYDLLKLGLEPLLAEAQRRPPHAAMVGPLAELVLAAGRSEILFEYLAALGQGAELSADARVSAAEAALQSGRIGLLGELMDASVLASLGEESLAALMAMVTTAAKPELARRVLPGISGRLHSGAGRYQWRRLPYSLANEAPPRISWLRSSATN